MAFQKYSFQPENNFWKRVELAQFQGQENTPKSGPKKTPLQPPRLPILVNIGLALAQSPTHYINHRNRAAFFMRR